MSSSSCTASSSASIASTAATSRQQKRVDFQTGYCGLSFRSLSEGGPALFKRIGTTAADGQPAKTTPISHRVRTGRTLHERGSAAGDG